MDVPTIADLTDSVIFGSENTGKILEICGVASEKIRIIEDEKWFEVGGYKIKPFLARHGKAPGFSPGSLKKKLKYPLAARDYRMDKFYAFHVEGNGISILTDPGSRPMNLPPSNILLISPRYNEGYCRYITEVVKPRVIIPIHWDNMWRPLSQTLLPMYQPPSLSIPPITRFNLSKFKGMVNRISREVKVFLPEILRYYDVKEILK
jgi:L-ascorbate metabolism protein UlaG (beta-lactamase superfamily)